MYVFFSYVTSNKQRMSKNMGYVKIVTRRSQSGDANKPGYDFSQTIECTKGDAQCTVTTFKNNQKRIERKTRAQLINQMMRDVMKHLPRPTKMAPPPLPLVIPSGIVPPHEHKCDESLEEPHVSIHSGKKAVPVKIQPASEMVKDIRRKIAKSQKDPAHKASKHLHRAVHAFQKGDKETYQQHLSKVVDTIRSASPVKHTMSKADKKETVQQLAKLVKALAHHTESKAPRKAKHHLKKVVEHVTASKEKGLSPLLEVPVVKRSTRRSNRSNRSNEPPKTKKVNPTLGGSYRLEYV